MSETETLRHRLEQLFERIKMSARASDVVTFNERRQEFWCRCCRYRDPLGPDGTKLHDDNCPWLDYLNAITDLEAQVSALQQERDVKDRAGQVLAVELRKAGEQVSALTALLQEQIAEHHSAGSNYCWWCMRDVNGMDRPRQPHEPACWLVRTLKAISPPGDPVSPAPQESEDRTMGAVSGAAAAAGALSVVCGNDPSACVWPWWFQWLLGVMVIGLVIGIARLAIRMFLD